MVRLSFYAKADLVVGGRTCSPDSYMSSPAGAADSASTITGFYLTVFASGDSEVYCINRLEGGEKGTLFELDWPEGAPDTVKFSMDFGQVTPKTVRSDHLGSCFVPVSHLLTMLTQSKTPAARNPSSSRAAELPKVILADNFTRNAGLLTLVDAGSDLRALSKLSLRPSSLTRLPESNRAVEQLAQRIENMLATDCVVSPANAGTQFTQGITSGHMKNHRLYYGTLGETFNRICRGTPVSLPLLMYNAFQAMHSTNLGFAALEAMPASELVPRFGLPLVSRHTCCALTNVYCPDITLAPTGAPCKLRETEDIARSLSSTNYAIQNATITGPYDRPLDRSFTLADAARAVEADQRALAADPNGLGARRKTPTLDADDCENKAQFIMQVTAALGDLSSKYRSTGGLSEAMQQAVKGDQALFLQCTSEHVRRMSAVLWRLSSMLGNGQWTMGLAVVSAKGPSFNEADPQAGNGLCGHGACVARVLSGADQKGQKLYQHYPVEGTTYLTVDYPVPKTHAATLSVKMADNSTQAFPVETLMGLVAQRVHELVGLSANANLLAHLRRDYGKNPLSSPFYVSMFYTSLCPGGDSSCLGSIPMNVTPGTSRPGFGAPFMGLSGDTVKTFPITSSMLAESGQDPDKMLELMQEQVTESWEPGLSGDMLRNYMTYLQPVKTPDAPALDARTYAASSRAEVSSAFDDPQVAVRAVSIYQKIAEKFNELQARDPSSDGARAQGYGQYLSACLGISLPLPKVEDAGSFKLTLTKNLVQAIKEMSMEKTLSACALKSSIIRARASVEADHHFYMCDRGEGVVHSFRQKLATH